MARNTQPRKPVESAVEMAIAAMEDSPRPSPLDQDMSAVDPSPTSLDLVLPANLDNRHAPSAGPKGSPCDGRIARRPDPESRGRSRFQPGCRRVHGSGATGWCRRFHESVDHICGAIWMTA